MLKHVHMVYVVLVAVTLLMGIVMVPSAHVKNQDSPAASITASIPLHQDYLGYEGEVAAEYQNTWHDNWKIAFNCHVRAEGVGDCSVLLLKQLHGNGDYSAKLLRLYFSSNSEVYVDEWQHTGTGVVNIIGYRGKYEFDDATHTYTINGTASVCFARIVD